MHILRPYTRAINQKLYRGKPGHLWFKEPSKELGSTLVSDALECVLGEGIQNSFSLVWERIHYW